MNKITATYTDLYELTMAQVFFKKGHNKRAVFDYYYRSNPYSGGYAVFCGLENLLDMLKELIFEKRDIDYLKSLNFDPEFLDYLKDFRFNGTIYSVSEGEIIFPNTPILQVEATISEAQIIETLLLNILNFQTLIATKARRIRSIAPTQNLMDMGLRRAHATGGYYASRAVMVGGFNGTSNTIAGLDFGIPVSGTMAHSFIQSYGDELEAFRAYADIHPDNCVFLVDTYNTLKSGIPNAITVGKELEARGKKMLAIRLDSGDLAYLAKKAREMLDAAGLDYVKIVASNQLDEYVIKSLFDQNAPIDIFGVGTSLVTGKPDASLDGVYKLSEYDSHPRIKISDNIIKVSLPSRKQVYRMLDSKGMFFGADAIGLRDEPTFDLMLHPFDNRKQLDLSDFGHEPLLHKVMENQKILEPRRSVTEIAEYSQKRLAQLPAEYKRFENPHIYKVGLSQKLKDQRDKIIAEHIH